jgi:hypothetical protein
MPTNKKRSPISPRQYVRRRGVARIDVAANRDRIETWLDEQYNAQAIYQALIDNGFIDGSYSYRTFLRWLYHLVPKSRQNMSRPESKRTTNIEENHQHHQQPFPPRKIIGEEKKQGNIIRTEKSVFTIPTDNITGDDD